MKQRGRKSAAYLAALAMYPDPDPPRPAYDPPPPPEYLGEPERQLWNDLFREYELQGIVAETLMATALCAHQRARECSEQIRRDGLVLTGKRGQIKVHPLFTAEQRALRAYYAGIKALRLGR